MSVAKGKVGVVDGGNSAIDAARIALRQEGVEQVTIIYRRTREEMPAFAFPRIGSTVTVSSSPYYRGLRAVLSPA